MFKGGKVLRLIPDQPQKGGSNTAKSSFIQVLDTREAVNIWVYQGKWQTTPGLQSWGPIPFPYQTITRSFAIHNYLKYDLTNAAMGAQSVILTHDLSAAGTHYINRVEAGPPIGRGQALYSAFTVPDSFTPAVFANIKNRCFGVWSGTNGFIWDGGNTLYNGNDYVYDIGVNGPVTAPTYQLYGSSTLTGGTTITDVSISVTSGSNFINAAWNDPLHSSFIFDAGAVGVSIGGVTYNVKSPGGIVTSFTTGGTAGAPGGSTAVTITGFLFPASPEWVGLRMDIDSPAESFIIESYTLVGADTHVVLSGNTAAHAGDTYHVRGTQLVLTTAFQGGTTYRTATVTYFNGLFTWTDIGPQYAYAYYDPVTGHISNISPPVQVSEHNQLGQSIILHDIMPSASTDQVRFTKIIIFRSQMDGSGILYPIGTFGYPTTFVTIPNTGAIGLDFIDLYDDSYLLLNSLLSGNYLLSNNSKPPAATHMMYWDGRLWLNPVGDPTAVVFSSNFDQTPFGIPEESFPPDNVLRVPSDDGRVRGMKLVGATAQVTTDRYSYAIVGGSDAASYRLARMGPQQFGVGDYQMDELPGDIGDNSTSLIYLSRDAREFILAGSYGNVPLTDPVSDIFAGQITTPARYYDSRINYFPATSARLLVTSMPDVVMVYNFDQKTWCQADPSFGTSTLRPEGMATIYGGENPLDLFIVNAGAVYRWMNVAATDGPSTAYLQTPPMDLMGGSKRRKRINFVRVYTDAPYVFVTMTVDESSNPFTMTAVPEPDPNYSLYSPGAFPVDSANAKELVAFALSALTSGTTDQIDGFRFAFKISMPSAFPPPFPRYAIYAIDIGFQILDADDDVAP